MICLRCGTGRNLLVTWIKEHFGLLVLVLARVRLSHMYQNTPKMGRAPMFTHELPKQTL